MTESGANGFSPFCRWLRSKRYYNLEAPPREESELLDLSQSCWCEHTQEAVGPGGVVVDPRDCRRERICFEAYGVG